MEVPGALFLECPECGKEVLHEILKGRGSERGGSVRLTARVRCSRCRAVRSVSITEQKSRSVPAILSDSGVSARTSVSLDPSSRVELGDVLILDGLPCLVTGIEVGTCRRPSASAGETTTLWLKRYDRVKVKVSVNTGRRTASREIWASPEEEFEVGDVIAVGDMKVLVHSISAGGRRVRRGMVKAGKTRRIYGREVE